MAFNYINDIYNPISLMPSRSTTRYGFDCCLDFLIMKTKLDTHLFEERHFRSDTAVHLHIAFLPPGAEDVCDGHAVKARCV